MKVDLNSDLGEGESLARTRALMHWITSANIACGGHAGDVASMTACVRLALDYRVHIGAHPGGWNRANHGRGAVEIVPDELELLLLQQIGALDRVARRQNASLHHIKLHGALYHAVESCAPLAKRYVEVVERWWPKARIYARANGQVAAICRKRHVRFWEEGFLDRAYQPDGALVPRTMPGALLTRATEVQKRVEMWLRDGAIHTVTGTDLSLRIQTFCIHSDTPNAPQLAKIASKQLGLK
ncbi:MAG: 5-oxoprolinase subunit PxpA [Verrucomicrobiota bacterium]